MMKKTALIPLLILLSLIIVACAELGQDTAEPTPAVEQQPAESVQEQEQAAEPEADSEAPAPVEEEESAEETAEAEEEAAEPTEDTAESVEEETESAAETEEPADEPAEPTEDTAESTEEESESTEEAPEPADEAAEAPESNDAGRLVSGSPWYLVAIEDSAGDILSVVEPGAELNLSIFEDGSSVTGFLKSECGLDIGPASFAGGAASFTPATEPPADCDPDSVGGRLHNGMRSAEAYQFFDDKLLVILANSEGTITFSSPNYVASWDEALANGLLHCGAPGAVLLVDSPNGRFLEAAGVSDVDALTPMQVGDHFEIGSNSKSFTDVIAMQLQEEGVWSLDDPLSQWLPEIAAQLPYGDQITLRQMAQNHSGIWDYADPLITAAIENDALDQAYTHQELADYIIAEGTPVAEPGTDEAWSYSSSNFIFLGMAIEAAAGQSLAELYQQRIFDPLAMDQSFLLEDVPEPGTIVQGYYTPGPGQPRMNTTNENGSQMWAAGGIVSTAEDMAKYVAGLAGGELFQDPASLEQMLDFGDQPVAGYTGYGLGLGKYASGNLNAWGHGGQTAGFETLWAYLPDQETTVIMLTNDAACSNATYFFPQIGASPDLIGE